MSDQPRPGKMIVASYAVSGIGVVTWIAYLVLKHSQQHDVPALLWTALIMVVVGFAIRRSQQST